MGTIWRETTSPGVHEARRPGQYGTIERQRDGSWSAYVYHRGLDQLLRVGARIASVDNAKALVEACFDRPTAAQ